MFLYLFEMFSSFSLFLLFNSTCRLSSPTTTTTTTTLLMSKFSGNYSCLLVNLKFTRDRSFYFTTVFIPGKLMIGNFPLSSVFVPLYCGGMMMMITELRENWQRENPSQKVDIYNIAYKKLLKNCFKCSLSGIILVTSSFITFWLEWNAVPARSMIGKKKKRKNKSKNKFLHCISSHSSTYDLFSILSLFFLNLNIQLLVGNGTLNEECWHDGLTAGNFPFFYHTPRI